MLGIVSPFPCGHMHLRSVGPSDRHPSVATRRPGGRQSTRAGAIIATITAVAPEVARLGPVRQTYASSETFPPVARAYTEVSQVVRETGLLARAQWFYALVGGALVLALGGAITGFILLGDTWYQLLIAGALGIIFTQVVVPRARGRAPADPRLRTRERPARALPRLRRRRHQPLVVEQQAQPAPREPQPRRQGPRHRGRHDPLPRGGCREGRAAWARSSPASRAGCSSRCSRSRA